MCARLGVDYVGLNLASFSSRYITWEQAESLWLEPTSSRIVAVVVDADRELLRRLLTVAQLAAVQFHGRETPEQLRELRRLRPDVGLWKALNVSSRQQLAEDVSLWQAVADLILLDGAVPGSGQSFGWGMLQGFDWSVPWGLAGGLHAANLPAAAALGPKLLDLASGAESAPGVKDESKVLGCLRALGRSL